MLERRRGDDLMIIKPLRVINTPARILCCTAKTCLADFEIFLLTSEELQSIIMTNAFKPLLRQTEEDVEAMFATENR